MKYLLDTNVIIDAAGGHAPAINALKLAVESEWVGYSAVTRLELFGYPGLQPVEETALLVIIGELEEMDVTSAIIDSAIRIRRNMRTKTPDAIIAATALMVGAVLVTRNVDDFKKIDGLRLVNPWMG